MDFQTHFMDTLKLQQPVHDFLEVMNGPEDGKIFEIIKDEVTIGRLPENDFCIPLELSVSRRHARLVRQDDLYQLEILPNARNPGIVMNKEVLPGQTAVIKPGQSFALGNVMIELGKARE